MNNDDQQIINIFQSGIKKLRDDKKQVLQKQCAFNFEFDKYNKIKKYCKKNNIKLSECWRVLANSFFDSLEKLESQGGK